MKSGEDGDANFYGEEVSSSESDGEDDDDDVEGKKKEYMMDPDHRLLLRSALPLLHSRNPGVILAVTQMYRYLAPRNEMALVIKPLVNLLRSSPETSYIALTTIVTLATDHKVIAVVVVLAFWAACSCVGHSLVCSHPQSLFESHLRTFYVRATDPLFMSLLKLEVLTLIANESNAGNILREFQAYVKSSEKTLVTQAIQVNSFFFDRMEHPPPPLHPPHCLHGLPTRSVSLCSALDVLLLHFRP